MKIRQAAKQTLLLLFAAFPFAVQAEGKWEAELAIENRLFAKAPRWGGQSPDRHNLSAALQPEYTQDWLGEALSFTGSGFVRVDETDSERNHADLREFNLRYRGEHYAVQAGLRRVFWGVTEAAHLVDIVNQSDLLENPDGEDKLGQPSVSIARILDGGALELFALPYFRERKYPGESGRLRPFLRVDSERPIYESEKREKHLDYAARLTQSLGGWDLGLSYFKGTSREPRLLLAVDGGELIPNNPPLQCQLGTNPALGPIIGGVLGPIIGDALAAQCEPFYSVRPVNPHLLPAYDQIEQAGLEVQWLSEGWFLKLESIYRNSRAQEYWAAVGGVEYSFGGVLDSPVDVTLVLEYLYDDRGRLPPDSAQGRAIRKFITGEPFSVAEARELQGLTPKTYSPLQNDSFIGTRIALNDEASSEMLIGAIADNESGATLVSIEGSRRLTEDWRLALEARAFLNVPDTDPLFSLSRDDYLQLEFIRYF